MLIVTICEKYKWDYYQYIAQPVWFLDLVKLKFILDNEKAERQSKNHGRY